MDRDAVRQVPKRGRPCLERTRSQIEQRGAELRALYTLVADLGVRQLPVLGRRSLAQMRRRVRKDRLLAQQQSQGKQDVG